MSASADIEAIRQAYMRMYDGMISKDEKVLNDVLDDSFALVHMTGIVSTFSAAVCSSLSI